MARSSFCFRIQTTYDYFKAWGSTSKQEDCSSGDKSHQCSAIHRWPPANLMGENNSLFPKGDRWNHSTHKREIRTIILNRARVRTRRLPMKMTENCTTVGQQLYSQNQSRDEAGRDLWRWGQTEGVGAVQPGEEKAPGWPQSSCQCLKGPTGRMERGFSQGGVVMGQGGTALN